MATRTMNCRDVGLRLQSYLDGELDSIRMEGIKAHLEDCVDCGLEADVFRRIKADLSMHVPPTDSTALQRLREFSDRIADEAHNSDI